MRHVVVQGEHAARFDDLNGDFREVCLTIFCRTASGWEVETSHDDCGYPRTSVVLGSVPNGPAWIVTKDPLISPSVRDILARIEPDSLGWYLAVIPEPEESGPDASRPDDSLPDARPGDEGGPGWWARGYDSH